MHRNPRYCTVFAALVLLAFSVAPAADEGKPVRVVDPLTGKVTLQAPTEPEEPEQVDTADLSKANKLVQKQDYEGAAAVLTAMLTDYPDDPCTPSPVG